MSNLAKYLKDLERAKLMRVKALKNAREMMKEVGLEFYQSAHFIDRFEMRAAFPVEAVRDFEVAIRVARNRVADYDGKKIAIKVGNHVFIFGRAFAGNLSAVTFWRTSLPAKEALEGRADILVVCS